MAIYQRGTVWWIDYYYKGRRIREPVSGTRKEAEKALMARQGDIVRGTFKLVKKGKERYFEEFAIEFLEHRKSGRKWWKKDLYRMKTLVHQFGNSFLSDISTYDIDKFKTARREEVSGPSVNRELALLKSMFNMAEMWGFLTTKNPVKGVRYYPERQKERILSNEEAERLIANCGETVQPVVVCALNTGMRKSELLDLEWKNVNFGHRFIRIERSKNNRSRKIPINSTVYEELSRLRRNGSTHVFTKGNSTEPLRCIRSAYERARRCAGLSDVRFHDLRHTFATNLVMGGIDLVTVKEILGHSTIEMTVRYSHPSDERKMSAVERLVSGRQTRYNEDSARGDGHNLVTILPVSQTSENVKH